MRLIPVVTALVIAGFLAFWILGAAGDAATNEEKLLAAAEAAEPTVDVVAIKSKAIPIENALVLRGQTEAFRKVDVKSEMTGLVVSEPLRAGARVSTGDLLCQIEPGERLVALEEAQARLDEAIAKDEAASQLSQRGFTAETAAKESRASLEAARTAVHRAELAIERLTIEAPFDGMLETDAAELGTLLQPGASCATVISLTPIKLVGFADENQVNRIAPGTLTLARLPDGTEISGYVTFVSRSADTLTRTFRVEVTAPNDDGTIRDGLTAEILVQLSGDVGHLLPHSALTLSDEGLLGVRIAVDDIARFRPVEIMQDTAEGIWVTGLEAEADVIVVGQEFIRDGRSIAVTYTERSALK
ncbi:MAG: efflux RND transporter periplasmic adaptor subunit [Pseudomonadota bacterium]